MLRTGTESRRSTSTCTSGTRSTGSDRGQTIFGENAARELWVCGPGAFVVLKNPRFPRASALTEA